MTQSFVEPLGTEFNDEDLEMEMDAADPSAQQLEKMFYENMSLSGRLSKEKGSEDPTTITIDRIEEKPVPFKYSISQHYTHTSHIPPALHPLQPSRQDGALRTLIKNDISPSTLLRSQLTLFEQAEDDQRSRLIELWRIVPPTYARNRGQEHSNILDQYQTKTVEQEEEVARLRYQGDVDEKVASPTDNFFEKYQHLPATMEHSPASTVSNAQNWSQELRENGYDRTFCQPMINNDMWDEEML